jgi:hypothetical protein
MGRGAQELEGMDDAGDDSRRRELRHLGMLWISCRAPERAAAEGMLPQSKSESLET